MNEKKIELFRYRSFGDLFTVTMNFIKQNFKQLIRTYLVYVFPIYIISGFGIGYYYSQFSGLMQAATDPAVLESFEDNMILSMSSAFISSILYLIGYVLALAITFKFIYTYANSDSAIKLKPKEMWDNAKSFIPVTIGYLILTFIILGLAFFIMIAFSGVMIAINPWFFVLIFIMLLFLIYLSVKFAFILNIKIEEPHLNYFECIGKSFELVKDHWWYSFGLIFIYNILISILSYIVLLPMLFIQFAFVFLELSGIATLLGAVITGLFYAVALLIANFVFIPVGMTFYGLYEKMTGKGISSKIDAIGGENSTIKP